MTKDPHNLKVISYQIVLVLCTFLNVFVVQFSRFAAAQRSLSIISNSIRFVKYFFEISQKIFFQASEWIHLLSSGGVTVYQNHLPLSSTFLHFFGFFSSFYFSHNGIRFFLSCNCGKLTTKSPLLIVRCISASGKRNYFP